MKKVLAALMVFALALAGCQPGKNYPDQRGKVTPSPSVTASPTPSLATSFVKGTYEAGKDIKPGRYGTEASFSTGTCILTINSAQNRFVAKFSIAPQQGVKGVEIRQGQKIVVSGGCKWTWEEPNK